MSSESQPPQGFPYHLLLPPVLSSEVALSEDEKYEFNVTLQDIGTEKIKVIKAIREIMALGLRESKELVESAPVRVKEGVSKDEAEKAKEILEASGAVILIE